LQKLQKLALLITCSWYKPMPGR